MRKNETKKGGKRMYNRDNEYVMFDWAIDKANFGVLEGLMTVLIGTDIKILEILESESNRESAIDKSNRVDVKAKTASGEIVLVEVQLAHESHFMQRILFGASKAIVEQLQKGQDYDNIKKVYSINVLYFDLGEGEDYVYHGTTTFRGMTFPDSVLKFNRRESEIVREGASVVSPAEVFPEYFLLRVNQFNEVAKTPIEEWMEYLKKGIIKPDTQTPGLQEAREKLDYMRMSYADRKAYERFMINLRADLDVWETAKRDGWYEGLKEGQEAGMKAGMKEGMKEGMKKGREEGMKKGREEGMKKGREEGMREGHEKGIEVGKSLERQAMARSLKSLGVDIATISKATGLSREEIEKL